MIHCGFFLVPQFESQSWWARPQGFKCPCKNKQTKTTQNKKPNSIRSVILIMQICLLGLGQAQKSTGHELSHLCSLICPHVHSCTVCGAFHLSIFLSLISFYILHFQQVSYLSSHGYSASSSFSKCPNPQFTVFPPKWPPNSYAFFTLCIFHTIVRVIFPSCSSDIVISYLQKFQSYPILIK